MSVLDRIRARMAAAIAPAKPAAAPAIEAGKTPAQVIPLKLYAGANVDRLNADWSAINTSADSELITGIRLLRARARSLVRDNEYAKNAVRTICNNVIGTGIRMQAIVKTNGGNLVGRINSGIEDAWTRWSDADSCHVAGKLSFSDIETLIMKTVIRDGEVLVRIVKNQRFGRSKIAFALEVIEPDRLVDFWTSAVAPNGNQIRMGVEVDDWLRPLAYWLTPNHPGDYQFTTFQASRFVRVPADEIIHLYVIDRWPQTRGEPWLHSSITRLKNVHGTEEGEIVKARAQAAIMGFIESPEAPAPDDVIDGQRVTDMAPGQIEHLLPGEKFTGFDPSGPNPALDPFLRYMLRAVAAGIGTSYESLTKDYGQVNYSSGRLALLDDRDNYRVIQGWLIRAFRQRVHREWLDQAVVAGEVVIPDFYTNREKYEEAVQFKPRGWSWIDPAKEVQAYKTAVRSGFMTLSDVIEQTGNGADAEETFRARRSELDMMADLELVFDTDSAQVNDKGIAQASAAPPATALNPAQEEAADTIDASGDASGDLPAESDATSDTSEAA